MLPVKCDHCCRLFAFYRGHGDLVTLLLHCVIIRSTIVNHLLLLDFFTSEKGNIWILKWSKVVSLHRILIYLGFTPSPPEHIQ